MAVSYGFVTDRYGNRYELIKGFSTSYFSIQIGPNGGIITPADGTTVSSTYYNLYATGISSGSAYGLCPLTVSIFMNVARTGYYISGWSGLSSNTSAHSIVVYSANLLNTTISTFGSSSGVKILGIQPIWQQQLPTPKQQLRANTAPKINGNSSITIKYGTSYYVSWSAIENAGSYNVYSVGESPGTYGYNFSVNPTKATSSPLSRGNWAKEAIGYYYRHYVQPIPKNSDTHVSPDAKDCGYVRVLVAGAVYLYDINGQILSGWNNKLATSWNSSQVSYSVSGYNPVKWFTKPNGQGTEYSNYSTAQFRSTGNLILYAYATKKQAIVTFDAQGGACSPATKTVNVGTDLNLSTATTITSVPAGKSFKGWSKSVNGAIISGTINIASNIKLYAVWIDNYNIGYNLNPTTLITGSILTTSPPSISGGEKKNGVDFPIYGTTPTMQGHTFLHWKDSSGTTYPVGGVYTANIGTTLTAIWSSNTYNLTFATPSNGAPGPTITSDMAIFNQNYVLPPVPPHDKELWAPKNPFWLVQNGASAASYPAGGNLPMIYANDNTVITPQWTQITSWRGGWLWIYVPEEGGFQ